MLQHKNLLPFLCRFHKRGRERRTSDKLSKMWRRKSREWRGFRSSVPLMPFPIRRPRRHDAYPSSRPPSTPSRPLTPSGTASYPRRLKKPSWKKKLPPFDLDSSASGLVTTLVIATPSDDGTRPDTTFVNCLVSVTEDGYSSSLISTETNSKRLKTRLGL